MALKPCKECGKEISTKAKTCPNCGTKVKKGLGCLTWFLGFMFLIFLIGVFSPNNKNNNTNNQSTQETHEVKNYKQGETINIGYTSYKVWKSWFSNTLSSNPYLNSKPDATYLFVQLTIRNDDKEARNIPPFKLIDKNGAEYETTSKGWAVEGSIGVLESLNPSVQKDGFIVFDVPNSNKYKLKLSGGYWSTDEALVELQPN